MTPTATYDFVIVGAGATGCVVAGHLARRFPEASVLLVEAGRARPGLVNTVPRLGAFAPFRRGTNWRHTATLCGREAALFQGRMPGGSSEINGMVVSLGAPEDYRPWQEAAGDDWAPETCLATMRGLQCRDGAHDAANGKMQTRQLRAPSVLTRAFLDAAAEAGQPVVADLNTRGGPRFGLVDANIRGVRRHSARAAFLSPWPHNLTLWRGAEAQHFTTDAQGRAQITLRRRRARQTVLTEAELILAAGAIGTAALLLRSGLGPADVLREAGIEVAQDMPEVGRNLQNHPSFTLRVPTRGDSLKDLLRPAEGLRALALQAAGRPGPLSEPLFEAAGYFAIPDTAQAAGGQLIMAPVLFPDGPRPGLPRRHGMTLAIQQGCPESRGRLVPRAGGGLSIDTGALDDPRDVEAMGAALAQVQEILSRPALAPHLDGRDCLARIDALRLRQEIGTAYHMAGTARMGRDASAPCTPRLRLRAPGRVRIADASAMPAIPNAALHFPSMMMAARAAAFIAEDHDTPVRPRAA
ncbi:GMC family oxidoreductase [Salipiger mucosus]|uniref:Choline dehydrogenase n=1 Tax=Salipiger mucosus DSM 16094 TaxID=1123237 RepID=S9RQN6_9RHOB|nr:GMC family oxidoreductase [Salipiger mucosus]EPX80375.1 Choline dehydrogenase [Salipiger mucosus DSM 16094]